MYSYNFKKTELCRISEEGITLTYFLRYFYLYRFLDQSDRRYMYLFIAEYR